MRAVFLLFLMALSGKESSGIKITRFNVPSTLNADEVDAVILDCVYEVDASLHFQLDIKWYFNQSHFPFYIWIPGYKPSVLPGSHFMDFLDLSTSHIDEKVSHKFNEHRAVKILSPGPTHSGEYTCKASTFIDEDTASAFMTVYGLPEQQHINASINKIYPHLLDVECQFVRVFPKPRISLEWHSANFSGALDGGMNGYIFPNEKVENAFDVEIFYEIELEEGLNDDIQIECSLEIVEVNEKSRLEYLFQFDKEEPEEESSGEESGSGYEYDLSGESGDEAISGETEEGSSGSGLAFYSGESGDFSGEGSMDGEGSGIFLDNIDRRENEEESHTEDEEEIEILEEEYASSVDDVMLKNDNGNEYKDVKTDFFKDIEPDIQSPMKLQPPTMSSFSSNGKKPSSHFHLFLLIIITASVSTIPLCIFNAT